MPSASSIEVRCDHGSPLFHEMVEDVRQPTAQAAPDSPARIDATTRSTSSARVTARS